MLLSPVRLGVAGLLLGLVLACVVATAGAGTMPAAAVTPAQLPGVMQLFGDATTVTARDGLLYFDSWRLLLVADASDPTDARLVGSADALFPHLLALRAEGDWLYALDRTHGLVVLSLAQPERPRIVARLKLPPFLVSLSVANGYAYLAGDGTGLVVVDVRDAEHPRLAATFRTPGPSHGVDVHGGFAYVADGPVGVTVVDIRQPERPRLAGGTLPSGIRADSVRADRDGLVLVSTDGLGVYVLDARSAPSLAVLGLVPVTLPVSDMVLMGDLVVFGDRDAMGSARLSADLVPGPVLRESLGLGSAVFVHQDRANIALSARYLITIRPDAPAETRMTPQRLVLPLIQVVADEHLACSIGAESGRPVVQLMCVDFSDVALPRPVVAQDVERQVGGTRDVAFAAAALQDGRLYLAEGGWWTGSSSVLHIFGLGDDGLTPLAQALLKEVEGVERIVIDGDALYTLNFLRDGSWVTRYSLAEPLAPRRVQSLQGVSGGRLALAEGRAYLTDGVELQILNTTNGGLRSLGSIVYNESGVTNGLNHGVVAVGEIGIVAGERTGSGNRLVIIDTHLPTRPKILGAVDCCASHSYDRGVKALTRRGDTMAAAGGAGGVALWDVASPEQPRKLYAASGYSASDIALTASHLVFIDRDATLHLWRYNPAPPPATATRTGPAPIPSPGSPTPTPSPTLDPTVSPTATSLATVTPLPTAEPSQVPPVRDGRCFLPWVGLGRGLGTDP